MRDRGATHPAAWTVLVLLSIVLSWWAWKQGAFFGVVSYPGTLLLCATALMLLWAAPFRGRLAASRPAMIAGACLLALGAWYALSALWSPAPNLAIADGQRVLAYAILFGLGAWLCLLLGRRTHLALAPLAIAGGVAGVLTVVTMLTGDDLSRYLEVDETLIFPLGYRNANSAFFLIALWAALGLASERAFDWRLRGLALGVATLCLDFALLSQSRGSMIAFGVALVVYVAVSPHRARSVVWLGLAALPALAMIPAASDLVGSGDAGDRVDAVVDELRGAGRAAALTAALAVLVGAIAARLEPRVTAITARAGFNWDRAVARLAVVVALAGAVAFVAAVGDPVDWVGQRVDEFREGGSPGFEGSRFSLNAGSGRDDLWRVALDDAAEDPLLGDGGGGYRYSYLRERDNSSVYARDAHSVELEVLSETGVPGLVLLFGAIGGAFAGALRARRLGLPAAALSAIALSAGVYWLVHASIDWFWLYPALTAPAVALLGAACAPAIAAADAGGRRRGRQLAGAGVVILALSVIPPFLSDRYVNAAYHEWRADPGRAYRDLDRAQALNPLADLPLLAEGSIARAAGDRERAIDAFERAADLRPEEWASHYFLALLYAKDDLERARIEIDVAREQDPRGERIEALRRRLSRG